MVIPIATCHQLQVQPPAARDRFVRHAGTLVPFGHGTDSKVPPTSGGAVKIEVLKMELSGSVYI